MDSQLYNNGYPVVDHSERMTEGYLDFGRPNEASFIPTPPPTNPSSVHVSPTWGSRSSALEYLLSHAEEPAFPPRDPAPYYQNANVAHAAPLYGEQQALRDLNADCPGWNDFGPAPNLFPELRNPAPATPYVEDPMIDPGLYTDHGNPTMVPQSMVLDPSSSGFSAPAGVARVPAMQPLQAGPVLLAAAAMPSTQSAINDYVEDVNPEAQKIKNREAARHCRENKAKMVAHLEGLEALWNWRADPRLHPPPSPPPAPKLKANDGRAKREERVLKDLEEDGTEETKKKNENARAARKSRARKKDKVDRLKAIVAYWTAEAYGMGWRPGDDAYVKYE